MNSFLTYSTLLRTEYSIFVSAYFCDFFIGTFTLYVSFIVVYSTIVSYVLFILSCITLQFGFLRSLFGLFCCSDTNTPLPCSTNGIYGIHRFPPPTAPHCQCWRSCSGHLPSTVNLPTPPCLRQVHPNNQACQTCPSKTFANRHAKRCETVPSFSKPTYPAIHTSRDNCGAPDLPHSLLSIRLLRLFPHCNATPVPVLPYKPISTE